MSQFDRFVDAFKQLSHSEIVACAVGSAIVVKRVHAFRYVRGFVVPTALVFVAYRACDNRENTPNVMEILLTMVDSVGCNRISSAFGDIVGLALLGSGVTCVANLLSLDFTSAKKDLLKWGFDLVRGTSAVQSIMDGEQKKMEVSFEKDLKTRARALGDANVTLPKQGMSSEKILDLMQHATTEENVKWESGLVSGAVYHGQHQHIDLLNEAFAQYSISNPLHPDIWPSVMKFEAEVISMTANMVNGANTGGGSASCPDVCGATTSGGTESIILAIKAHRDYWRDNFGITKPEIVVGNSAHAAVDKACDMMGIKLIKVSLDAQTFKINIDALRAAIGPNTIMMYASAPSFPHGAIDPVRQMGQIALKYNIGLHVDCCLGGFFLPFGKTLGYSLPDFDFTVPGVTSMSLDTHKYGYALKGTSVVLYKNKVLRQSQYFCYADWTGGMYTTPTIAGSRSGGLIAQCWASLVSMGEEGYCNHTRDIFATVKAISEGVRAIEGLRLLGLSEAMIVCFDATPDLNIYSVGDKMTKRGWSLNALQFPSCLHLCCTVAHVGKHQKFLDDLQKSVDEVRANPDEQGGSAAIYGLTSTLPAGPVNDLLKVYNDVVLKI